MLTEVRVRFHIIRNARIENVGKSQSCMVSKLRIIWKQTVSPFGEPPLLGLLHLCMAGAVSGGLGQLYVQRPDPTADGEGVPAEGASGVVLVQQVCRPFSFPYATAGDAQHLLTVRSAHPRALHLIQTAMRAWRVKCWMR